MPTGYRREWAQRALRCFLRQDYQDRELVIVDEGPADLGASTNHPGVRYLKVSPGLSVGEKRNIACELAAGDIILHWDDDDWSAEWRIAYQVGQLLTHDAGVSGVSDLILCDAVAQRGWQYRYPREMAAWVAGGTLCYWKEIWLATPFEAMLEGEDTAFVASADPQQVVPCALNTFYIATMHERNTSAKRPAPPLWEEYSIERIRALLADDARDYLGELVECPGHF